MSAILALASAAVFGVADFVGGRASAKVSALRVTLVSNLVGGLIAGVLALIVPTVWSVGAIGWGAAAGSAGFIGLMLLYHGLATGPNRLVSPVSAVVAAVVPVTAGFVSGERFSALQLIGLALAPVAVWLVADGAWSLAGDRRSLGIAVAAGVGFGIFFVLLARTPGDAGAAPLVAARAGSLVIVLAVILVRRERETMTRDAVLAAAGAGVLDMVANGLYLWAVQDGDLAITAALVSLFPVTTVMLAMFVLKERLQRNQIIGFGLALVAAALLS